MDETALRKFTVTLAVLVAPEGVATDVVEEAFKQARVRVQRVFRGTQIYEEIAASMPHVIVVMDDLTPLEREKLDDCATAVGAPVLIIDPHLEPAESASLANRAADLAVKRRLEREAAAMSAKIEAELDEIDVEIELEPDVDNGW